MGNKVLRPSPIEPLSGFNDDQLSYLHEKFQILCDERKLLDSKRIAQAYKCTSQQADRILSYIDFDGEKAVDFYEFTCAAASLHQNDEMAFQFLYELFGQGEQLDENCFKMIFSTIFKYLIFINLIPQKQYNSDVASKKFKQYDYNQNSKIGEDQFKALLKNDYHARLWMENLGFAEERPNDPPERIQNEQDGQFTVEQAQGQQAGSTPSWVHTINYMAPTNEKKLKASSLSKPSSNLQIDYVYGYRCYDTRDNLRYNNNEEVVYHTAGCGIVLNKSKNTMRIMTDHNDDITCLDMHAGKNLVVTGQMGKKPYVLVWDSTTMQVKNTFQGKLQRSIAAVAISKSGKYVAAISQSDKHEIAIFDITKNAMIAFGQGPKSVVHAIKFSSNQQQIILACQKQVIFAKFAAGKIQIKKGVFGKAPLAANYCIALVNDAVITGMGTGVLGYWKGNTCSRIYKQHSKPVQSLSQRQDGGLISGDTIGNIVLWNRDLSKQREFSLSKLTTSNNFSIISLHQKFNSILIGTRGGQIIELSQKNNSATIIMEGHFDKQLWGLSNINQKHEFITGGQDKLLIKWDSDKRKAILKKKLDTSISVLDVSCNNVIAVGHTNGVVNFYSASKFEYLKRIQSQKNPDKQMISVVKFSPNGNTIAVGYCPPVSMVYLYNVQDLKVIGKCKGSPSRINSIDFTRDGKSIMINNTSYQILFFDSINASQIKNAKDFKNQQFATLTCRFSWQTQGIWPPCSDGSDINALDRSNSKKYLVTGDDFSKVKLFKYPACNKNQIHNSYKGHSSHITGVKWSSDDKFIITIGGLQKSIIQWTFDDQKDIEYVEQQQQQQQVEQKKQQQQLQQKSQQQQQQQKYEFQIDSDEGDQNVPRDQDDFGLQIDQGDEALAVKPFLGQVKRSIPSSFKSLNQKNVQPNQSLQVKQVWGIRNQFLTDRVRDQLRYSPKFDSCLFITAALGVDMDLKSKQQTFYQGHSEDLVAFAMTKDRKLCATGQMAQLNKQQPKSKILDIHIWDSQTKQRKKKLTGFHQRAVYLLQFSPSGKRLLSVGQDDKNSLAVYEWQVGRKAWSSAIDGAKVTGAAWKNQEVYMTVGYKHATLWTKEKGTKCKIPSSKWDPMMSVVYWNDKFVSGGSEGVLYLWTGSDASATKGAHAGRVDSLRVDDKGVLFSGCSKGIINKWKYSGGKLVLDTKILDMCQFDKFSPGILSMDFSPNNMLICTNSSSIYQIPKGGKVIPQVIMQSHYLDELWAQSWSPDSSKFVTGGDDKTIRIYDSKTFQMLHSFKMKQRIRGIDWQKKNGDKIVVGDNKGKIYLFDTKLKQLCQPAKTKFSKTKPRKEPFWIEDIKFSPNGKHVAFGAHGGCTHIQIFDIEGDKFGKGRASKNLISSAMLSVDWSQDSEFLAVVSQAYELQFVDKNLSMISASSTQDVKWETWTGKFGAYVQHIHQDVDYSNINAVDRSPSGNLIATGGDDQKIRLFKCPVHIPKQKNKSFTGHSSHVTKIRFSKNEKFLLSVGGNDRTIIMWKVIGNNKQEQKKPQTVQQISQEQSQAISDHNQQAEQISIPIIKEKATVQQQTQDQDDENFGLDEDGGDEFMAVKPWLGAIKEPSIDYYKGNGKAPKVQLIPEYAYGYRTKDCRNNLIYASPQIICYHTAGLGISMKTAKKEQRFFSQHSDDIISMTWNQQKSQIFTGQMGNKPVIHRWSSQGKSIQKYKGVRKGVSAIGVNDQYVAAAGMDDNHQICLFQIESGKMITSQKGGRQFITALKWFDEQNFVTVGIKHYRFWTVSGKVIKSKTGLFGKNCNLLTSLVIYDRKIYVGASDGSLQIWSGNTISKCQKIHDKKSLNALTVGKNIILTGSKDKTIKILDRNTLKIITSIDCKKLLRDSVCPQIQAIDFIGNKIIIGTKGSQIYEIKSQNCLIEEIDSTSEFRFLARHMSGHYAPNFVTNQVWGLAKLDDRLFVTSSDDGTLRVWDIQKKEQYSWFNLDIDSKGKDRVKVVGQKFLPNSCKANCIWVASDGNMVVGCRDGKIRVLNNKFEYQFEQQISKKQISQVKISPDQSILAVGDRTGKITLLQWNPTQSKMKILPSKIKHHSAIKHFDFSSDSNIIHSTCTSYELLFWDVSTGKQITGGATQTRDTEWATWSLSLGWPVQGIFEPEMDGTDINAVDRSNRVYGKEGTNGMQLVATSDDRGHVRILEYPCLKKNSEAVVGSGHSSHVTNIKWSSDDKRLFSTGGEDQTVIQWIVETNY